VEMTSLGYKTHYIILKQKNIFHIFYTENEQHHAKKQKNTTEISLLERSQNLKHYINITVWGENISMNE